MGCAFQTAETKAYSNASGTDPAEREICDTRLKGAVVIGNGGWNLEIGLSVAEAWLPRFVVARGWGGLRTVILGGPLGPLPAWRQGPYFL